MLEENHEVNSMKFYRTMTDDLHQFLRLVEACSDLTRFICFYLSRNNVSETRQENCYFFYGTDNNLRLRKLSLLKILYNSSFSILAQEMADMSFFLDLYKSFYTRNNIFSFAYCHYLTAHRIIAYSI